MPGMEPCSMPLAITLNHLMHFSSKQEIALNQAYWTFHQKSPIPLVPIVEEELESAPYSWNTCWKTYSEEKNTCPPHYTSNNVASNVSEPREVLLPKPWAKTHITGGHYLTAA